MVCVNAERGCRESWYNAGMSNIIDPTVYIVTPAQRIAVLESEVASLKTQLQATEKWAHELQSRIAALEAKQVTFRHIGTLKPPPYAAGE